MHIHDPCASPRSHSNCYVKQTRRLKLLCWCSSAVIWSFSALILAKTYAAYAACFSIFPPNIKEEITGCYCFVLTGMEGFGRLRSTHVPQSTDEGDSATSIECVLTKAKSVIGRKSSSSGTLAVEVSLGGDKTISRQHAEISFEGEGRASIHCMGRNGIEVNGRKLELGKQVRVVGQAEIKIGQYQFDLEVFKNSGKDTPVNIEAPSKTRRTKAYENSLIEDVEKVDETLLVRLACPII